MTEKPRDLSAALDVVEDAVELQQTAPDVLLSELATLLLGFPRDSFDRPRVHRMLGVVYSRMDREADAFSELRDARALASSLSPPNYRELGNIAREMSVMYAARGEDRRATDELMMALAFTSIGGDRREITRLIAQVGHGELKAQRYDNGALLFGFLISGDKTFKVREHAVQAARISLIQALNALGRHDDVHPHVKDTHATLTEADSRLRFLTQLEAARAFAGLGRHDEAEGALLVAENFLPDSDTALEHSEFIEAVMELQEVRSGDSAIGSLEQLITQHTEQNQLTREVVVRRALANVLLKRSEVANALDALGEALCAALRANLDVAGDIRAELLRRAGAARLIDLTEAKDLLGQHEEGERRFVQLRSLGRGSAGESVLAVDIATGGQVSLRTLDLGFLDEGQRGSAVGGIKTGYAAAAALNDSRVASLRDLRLAASGLLYSVQRYPDGPTLRELYASGVETNRMLELLAGTASALGVLHARGVVHRDLRPDHVIVARDDQGRERPVLIEFGMAPVEGLIGAGDACGTPPYVAPEQVSGDAVDAQADVYALGQMIAEIWGGRVPSRANLGRLWKRDAENQMPRAIGDLVRGMTAQDPARRTADLGEIVQTLRAQREQAD